MAKTVLDASAVLAVIFDEPGADRIEAQLPGAWVSTVTMEEVTTRLLALGMPADTAETIIESLQLTLQAFDPEQARATARLKTLPQAAGQTLENRAGLALAYSRRAELLTAQSVDPALAEATDVRMVAIR